MLYRNLKKILPDTECVRYGHDHWVIPHRLRNCNCVGRMELMVELMVVVVRSFDSYTSQRMCLEFVPKQGEMLLLLEYLVIHRPHIRWVPKHYVKIDLFLNKCKWTVVVVVVVVVVIVVVRFCTSEQPSSTILLLSSAIQ
jgi:hypothetical protein